MCTGKTYVMQVLRMREGCIHTRFHVVVVAIVAEVMLEAIIGFIE